MTRSKKLFAGFALVFVIILLYVSYDISTRTTFPGSKPQLKERLENKPSDKDTVAYDSATKN